MTKMSKNFVGFSARRIAAVTLTAGVLFAGATIGVVTTASRADAQSLGPQRQFLAIEPYYEYTRLDFGQAVAPGTKSVAQLQGYGGRLWINGAPFHFFTNSSIALFASYAPKRGDVGSASHYGGEIDQFFNRRPLGNFLDPFVTLGIGAYKINANAATIAVTGPTDTHFALSPGFGLRIPVPNRFELRGDVRDLLIFDSPTGQNGESRVSHNLVMQAGLGITF